jgi:CHAD domain-containing protein
MAYKNEVRKQQDTSRSRTGAPRLLAKSSVAKAAQEPLAQINSLAEAFNAAVEQYVQSGDGHAVHRVRTGSRRLQATVEATLRERGPDAEALRQPARVWLRRVKQIRRAAGPVRDLDVQRKLLESWIEKRMPKHDATGSLGDLAGEASRLRKEAEKLDTWLRGERKHLSHGMQKQIRKRQRGLAERQSAFFTAVAACDGAGFALAVPRPADAVALDAFVRAADSIPLLHADNLHDFRKATKKARYVAEAGAEGEKHCVVAKALKRIQDAIGDWHDWLCLAQEAKAALGQDAPELSACFQQEVERHFAVGMKTTQSMRGRLLGEWMAGRSKQAGHAKRSAAATAIADRSLVSGF